jgi:glucose dehydrogenase
MMRKELTTVALAIVATAAVALSPASAGPVTADDLLKAQDNAGEWLMYGRDYRNWRFSPLDRITPENVGQLKPVWAFSTGGSLGGLEGTPLMRDGVLYVSGDYSRVFAMDARSGTLLWSFEPVYEEGVTAVVCCGPVNRGLRRNARRAPHRTAARRRQGCLGAEGR